MQMTRVEILEKLKEIIAFANSDQADKVEEAARINQDLGFTSIGMLYVSIAVEESFGIRFEDVGVSDFVTIKDLVDYIEGKL